MSPATRVLLIAILVTACAGAYVQAHGTTHNEVHHRHLKIDDDTLSWNSEGRLLQLHSTAAGIAVDGANTLGLQRGDTITAFGDQSIHSTQGLLDGLRGLQGHSAALQVRGADGEVHTVRLSASQYTDLLPPPPPAPPLPPPPPRPQR